MTDRRLTLSEREKPSSERPGLYEGVPDWVRSSLVDWVDRELGYEYKANFVITYLTEEMYRRISGELSDRVQGIERRVRITPPLNCDGDFPGITAMNDLRSRVRTGPEELVLDIIDDLVGDSSCQHADELGQILQEAGSVWRVGTSSGWRGLVRRVDPVTQATSEQAMDGGEQHHRYLQKAWAEAYGRSPSPDTAYRDAVRAVEAVSIPLVTPSQSRATLGSAIAQLRDNPESYATRLTPSEAEPDSVTVVREVMQLLWKSQWDRHGVDDTSIPLTVTQEEAEDALGLAVMLVRWFDTGAIYRK